MTFKEERYKYVNLPRSMVGSDNFWEILKFTQPKPKENEKFEFLHFGNDNSKGTEKEIRYFWIYNVFEL